MAFGLDLGNLLVHLKANDSQFNRIMGGAMRTMKRYAKYVAVAGIAQITLSVREYAKFEEQMANVSTMLDDHTMRYMPAYEKAMKSMAMEFGESTETLSKGLYDILSASIPPAEALKVLTISAKAAKAGMTSTAVAADAITTVLNSYGMAASEAGRISDILFATVKRGKTTFAELAPNIGKVAAIASTANLSFEEVSAALSTMTRAGLQADLATTSLRSIMNTFIKPTDDAATAARQMGFELSSTTLKAMGLTGVLKKLKGATAEQLAAIMPNVRGLAGFAAALKQAEGMASDLDLMLNSLGLTQIAYDKMTQTLMHTFNRFWQSIKITSVAIGSYLEPAVRKVTEAMIEWMGAHQQEIGLVFVKIIKGMVEAVDKLVGVVKKLPIYWKMVQIEVYKAGIRVYELADAMTNLDELFAWIRKDQDTFKNRILMSQIEVNKLRLEVANLAEQYVKDEPKIESFFDSIIQGLERSMLSLEADKALRDFLRGWESLKDVVKPTVDMFKDMKNQMIAFTGLDKVLKEVSKDAVKVETVTKEIVKNTMTLTDAYRAMRNEMGRMTEDVYQAQLKIIEGLRKEYEQAGVSSEALIVWNKEQIEVLQIEYLRMTDSIANGFKAAGMQIKREIKTWGEKAYEFSMTLENSIARGLENTMRNFDNWKEHLLNVFEEVYWAAVRIAFIQPMAKGLAGAMTAGVGALFAGGAGMPTVGTVTPQAGATMTKFQHGGIAWKPQIARVAEKEPELITPFSQLKGLLGGGAVDIYLHNEGTKQEITKAESYMVSDQRIIDVWVRDAMGSGSTNRTVKSIAGSQ